MKPMGCGHLILVIIAVLFGLGTIGAIIGKITADPKQEAAKELEQQKKSAAEEKVKKVRDEQFSVALGGASLLRKSMRDPDSFKISSALVIGEGNEIAVCYEYRSRNGFGGMNQSSAVVTNDAFINEGDVGFYSLWNKKCAGKIGTNFAEKIMSTFQQYDKLHNY